MINDAAFIADAKVTESVPEQITITATDVAMLKAALALTEIVDQLKKHIFYGRELNVAKIEESKLEALDLLQTTPNETSVTISNKEHIRICHSILGMNTESGELINVLLDIINTGDYDRVNFLEEMGDTQWYTGTALDATESTYQTLFDLVIAKLKKRYPNGKFESDRAINRNVDEEYSVMTEHAS